RIGPNGSRPRASTHVCLAGRSSCFACIFDPRTGPIQLCRGFPTMVVGAAYDALGHFCLECGQRVAALGHDTDVHALGRGIDVVELEHYWVRLAAIDAWVGNQIIEQPTA